MLSAKVSQTHFYCHRALWLRWVSAAWNLSGGVTNGLKLLTRPFGFMRGLVVEVPSRSLFSRAKSAKHVFAASASPCDVRVTLWPAFRPPAA
jgi:hypothetical protein